MDLRAGCSQHGNRSCDALRRQGCHRGDDNQNILVLNVLLLGGCQSGRSSVANALIGGHEFQTGSSVSGVTTECHLLSRTFPKFFRRQGTESDLKLRIIDTPPQLPHPRHVHKLCPEGVHVLAVVVRADLPHKDVHVQQQAESLFGPEWRQHALLILTHADHLKALGLQPPAYLSQITGWLQGLAGEVEGGVLFLDNTCDWPSIRGRPLRDRLLHLSAKNHHRALAVRTEVSL